MRQEPVQAAADGYINSEFHGDEPQASAQGKLDYKKSPNNSKKYKARGGGEG